MQHRVYFVCVSSQAFVFSFVILGPIGGCFSDSDDNDSDANKVRTYKVIRSKYSTCLSFVMCCFCMITVFRTPTLTPV